MSYDEQLIEWIKSYGLIPDETSRVGSDPLFEEIVETGDSLPECTKKHHDSFIEYFIDVKCDDDYSTIHVFTGADRIVTHLIFEGSPNIMQAIVRRLANIRGSYIVLGDGEADMLINPE